MSKWISVKDKLPEYNEHVLIFMKYDDEPFMAFRTEKGWTCVRPEMADIVGDGYFEGFFEEYASQGIEVTHWLKPELPEVST